MLIKVMVEPVLIWVRSSSLKVSMFGLPWQSVSNKSDSRRFCKALNSPARSAGSFWFSPTKRCGLKSASASSSADNEEFKPRPGGQPALVHLCHSLELCFFEACVQNMGRPAGLALHGFVSAAVTAFLAGYTRDQLSLQLAYGSTGMQDFQAGLAGYRITAVEEHYRSKWLETVYATLQLLKMVDNEASKSAATHDMNLVSIIHRILEGQQWLDEQSLASFDRGLATKGASGGVVSKKIVIAPQLMPVTQLVLLTLKVVNEAN